MRLASMSRGQVVSLVRDLSLLSLFVNTDILHVFCFINCRSFLVTLPASSVGTVCDGLLPPIEL